jgi:cytochrome bd-type quinol oxidase subunit 2
MMLGRLASALALDTRVRIRNAARRASLRAALLAGVAVLAFSAAAFVLIAATAALAEALGLVPALLIMAALMLAGVLVLLIVLSLETRRARRFALRRESLARQATRAALLSAAPTALGRPPKGMLGYGLMALGVYLVLRRRDD